MADAFKIGTMGTDDLTGRTPRILTIPNYLAAAGNAWPAQYGGANYQVPGGTAFYCTGVMLKHTLQGGTSYTVTIPFTYADDAALVTNPVIISGFVSGDVLPLTVMFPIYFTVPAGHYLGQISALGMNYGGCIIFGYEQV